MRKIVASVGQTAKISLMHHWSIPWNGQPLPGISKIYMECYLNTLYWSYNSFLHIKMNFSQKFFLLKGDIFIAFFLKGDQFQNFLMPRLPSHLTQCCKNQKYCLRR